jgi:hypothetical protein
VLVERLFDTPQNLTGTWVDYTLQIATILPVNDLFQFHPASGGMVAAMTRLELQCRAFLLTVPSFTVPLSGQHEV